MGLSKTSTLLRIVSNTRAFSTTRTGSRNKMQKLCKQSSFRGISTSHSSASSASIGRPEAAAAQVKPERKVLFMAYLDEATIRSDLQRQKWSIASPARI